MRLHRDMNERDWIRRIKGQLPRSRDPILVVLKGHLLLEEALEQLISASCDVPSELEKARLTFAQKLSLVCALSPILSDSDRSFVRKLNAMRNKMAHRLDGFDAEHELNAWRFRNSCG